MNEQEFRELSAARALHALSPEEEQAFSLALAAHPEWRSVVDEDRETAAALGAAAPEVSPSEASRAAILDLISRTPQFDGTHTPVADPAPDAAEEDGPEEAPRRPRRRAAWFVLAASVAVLLAVSLSFPWGSLLPAQDPAVVALQQIEASPDADTVTAELPDGSKGALHWSDQVRKAVLVTEGMSDAPSGRDYELWIVRGEQPTSLGVMRVGPEGEATVLAAGFEPGDALAVTIEDRGGSPTGAPTTDPLFVLAAA